MKIYNWDKSKSAEENFNDLEVIFKEIYGEDCVKSKTSKEITLQNIMTGVNTFMLGWNNFRATANDVPAFSRDSDPTKEIVIFISKNVLAFKLKGTSTSSYGGDGFYILSSEGDGAFQIGATVENSSRYSKLGITCFDADGTQYGGVIVPNTLSSHMLTKSGEFFKAPFEILKDDGSVVKSKNISSISRIGAFEYGDNWFMTDAEATFENVSNARYYLRTSLLFMEG